MKKQFGALLAWALVLQFLCLGSVMAQDPVPKDQLRSMKLKSRAATFENSGRRVNVKLNDGDKIGGYISQVSEEYFVVVDSKGQHPILVRYANVRDLGSAEKFGSGAKFGLAIGAGFLAVIGICAATQRCQN